MNFLSQLVTLKRDHIQTDSFPGLVADAMVNPPEKIRAIREAGVFEIVWAEGKCFRYPFKFLRCECPCAGCVNEFTGERLLDPDTVPESILPTDVSFSGNYALKIHWNDGHNTGLYTWELFDRLKAAPAVEVCAPA